jgi:putative transposase
MQYIKGNFSFRLKSKVDVWERSYDSRRITDAHNYTTHIAYIHHNPVRAKLSADPGLYPHSSANPIHPSDPTPTHFI